MTSQTDKENSPSYLKERPIIAKMFWPNENETILNHSVKSLFDCYVKSLENNANRRLIKDLRTMVGMVAQLMTNLGNNHSRNSKRIQMVQYLSNAIRS